MSPSTATRCASALPARAANWSLRVKDRRVAKIIKACQDLPGQELLQYVDEAGNRQDVTSTDVNEYLKEITGKEITAKDFRTWAGTVLAAMALNELESFALAVFGAVVWLLATDTAPGCLVLATIAWFVVAILLWRVRRTMRT
jgi:DNA topoisomerase IB